MPPSLGFVPPPLRGAAPRMLPPGPPPGRPSGLPPQVIQHQGIPLPHGLPPRLPPGPPMGIRPPAVIAQQAQVKQNPNVLSAPPSIMKSQKPSEEQSEESGSSKKGGATISAKPQIKHVMGDITRFTPTALKVKRTNKDSRGRIIRPSSGISILFYVNSFMLSIFCKILSLHFITM